MNIYIASSWKNEKRVRTLAKHLRQAKFDVDDFTDDSKGRYVFQLRRQSKNMKNKFNDVVNIIENGN